MSYLQGYTSITSLESISDESYQIDRDIRNSEYDIATEDANDKGFFTKIKDAIIGFIKSIGKFFGKFWDWVRGIFSSKTKQAQAKAEAAKSAAQDMKGDQQKQQVVAALISNAVTESVAKVAHESKPQVDKDEVKENPEKVVQDNAQNIATMVDNHKDDAKVVAKMGVISQALSELIDLNGAFPFTDTSARQGDISDALLELPTPFNEAVGILHDEAKDWKVRIHEEMKPYMNENGKRDTKVYSIRQNESGDYTWGWTQTSPKYNASEHRNQINAFVKQITDKSDVFFSKLPDRVKHIEKVMLKNVEAVKSQTADLQNQITGMISTAGLFKGLEDSKQALKMLKSISSRGCKSIVDIAVDTSTCNLEAVKTLISALDAITSIGKGESEVQA